VVFFVSFLRAISQPQLDTHTVGGFVVVAPQTSPLRAQMLRKKKGSNPEAIV